MKKLFLLLIICINLTFAACINIKKNSIKDEGNKDIQIVENIVNTYYISIHDKKYEDALNIIDFENDNSKKNSLFYWLNENSKLYNIGPPDKPNKLIQEIDYSHKLKQYRIVCLVRCTYKDKDKDINEYIYIRKTRKNYKIVYIESSDENIKYRSNMYGNIGNSIFNSSEYQSLY
ncbi:MAG: hypothetical protein N2448_00990 [Caloramator sp.]|nr:hypothetical protein [Caloramator sp.]